MNLLPEVFVKVIATTQAQCVNSPDFEALWVIRKSQVAIPEGFRVALDLEIGNTIHNFEPGGEIQFVKAHAVAELGESITG